MRGEQGYVAHMCVASHDRRRGAVPKVAFFGFSEDTIANGETDDTKQRIRG